METLSWTTVKVQKKNIPLPMGAIDIWQGFVHDPQFTSHYRFSCSAKPIRSYFRITLQNEITKDPTPYVLQVDREDGELRCQGENKEAKVWLATLDENHLKTIHSILKWLVTHAKAGVFENA